MGSRGRIALGAVGLLAAMLATGASGAGLRVLIGHSPNNTRTNRTATTWPFSFHRHEGWDTRNVANGSHMLVVRAYGTRRYRMRKRLPVRVDNPPLQLQVLGVSDGSAVSGVAHLGVDVSEPVQRVALYADGKAVSRDATAPYGLIWDTRTVARKGRTRCCCTHARTADGGSRSGFE
jgi:hypothetical protein